MVWADFFAKVRIFAAIVQNLLFSMLLKEMQNV